jgi:hypothetical protein
MISLCSISPPWRRMKSIGQFIGWSSTPVLTRLPLDMVGSRRVSARQWMSASAMEFLIRARWGSSIVILSSSFRCPFSSSPIVLKKQCLLFSTDFAGWGHHQHWCYCLLECTSYCFCISNLAIRISWGVLSRLAPGIPWWHLKNIFLWRGRWTY